MKKVFGSTFFNKYIVSILIFSSLISNIIPLNNSNISNGSSEYRDILENQALTGVLSAPLISVRQSAYDEEISVFSAVYINAGPNQNSFEEVPDILNVYITKKYIDQVIATLDKKPLKVLKLEPYNITTSKVNFIFERNEIKTMLENNIQLEFLKKNCIARFTSDELMNKLDENVGDKLIITIADKAEEDAETIKGILADLNTNLEVVDSLYDIYVYSIRENKPQILYDILLDMKIKIPNIKENDKLKIKSALIDTVGNVSYLLGDFKGDVFEFKTDKLFTFVLLKDNKTFDDIKDNIAKKEIEALAASGYLDVLDDKSNNFYPKKVVTRGEYADVISKIFKISESPYEKTYKDVESTDGVAKYLSGLKEKRLLVGYGDKFGINDALKRQDMAVSIGNCFRYLQNDDEIHKVLYIKDRLNVSKYALKNVYFIVDRGLMTIDGEKKFMPKDNLVREQLAIIVYRVLKQLKIN